MPITKQVLEQYISPTFVETGTYGCGAVSLARDLGFQLIHTIDINRKFVKRARRRGYAAHYGDSPDILAKILPAIEGPITFWLDAHPCGIPIDIFQSQFPLMRELRAILANANPGKHVILIDDMRMVGPWEKKLVTCGLQLLWPHAELRWHGDCFTSDDILCCDMRET